MLLLARSRKIRTGPSLQWKDRSPLIARQILERLHDSGYLALREVDCQVRDGVAILDGQLRSQFLKQIAQSVILDIAGVRRIENRIVVRPAAVVVARQGFGEALGSQPSSAALPQNIPTILTRRDKPC